MCWYDISAEILLNGDFGCLWSEISDFRESIRRVESGRKLNMMQFRLPMERDIWLLGVVKVRRKRPKIRYKAISAASGA